MWEEREWRAAIGTVPELTAERFVPDPFSYDPIARLYRSGDWRGILTMADLEFLGRAGLPSEGPRIPHRTRRDRSRTGASIPAYGGAHVDLAR